MDKNTNNNTKHFIIGLLSGLLFIPVIEEFLNVIIAWIQVLILKPNKIVLKGNKDIAELQSEEEPVQTSCIGFQVSSEEDDDYYEDDGDY